jgi:hypothetical protein
VSPVAGRLRSTSADVRPSGVAARNVGIVKTGEHPDQPLVVIPRDTELARFGEARLPDAHRILRVPARWKRQIREQGAEWRRKSLTESSLELLRQAVSTLLRDLHGVPETAMREEMIILAFVPASVAKQCMLEVRV